MFLKNVEHAERMTRWTCISCASSQARVRSKKSLLSLRSRRAFPRLDSNSFQRRQNFSPCSIVTVRKTRSLRGCHSRWRQVDDDEGLESWHKLRAELRVELQTGRAWPLMWADPSQSEVIPLPGRPLSPHRTPVTLSWSDKRQEERCPTSRSKLVIFHDTAGSRELK